MAYRDRLAARTTTIGAGRRDLLGAAAAALVCAAVAGWVHVTTIRAIFAVPLCLILPGYGLTAATFARQGIAKPQLLFLTVAMSLSILATGSVLLNFVPGGLRTGTWAAFLLIVTVSGCAIGALRRPRRMTRSSRFHLPRPRFSEAALLLVSALIVAGAFSLAATPLSARHALGYTRLWMLQTGTPTAPSVSVGVASAEQGSVAYRLDLEQGSASAVTSFYFALTPGGQYQRSIPVATSSVTAADVCPPTAPGKLGPETLFGGESLFATPPSCTAQHQTGRVAPAPAAARGALPILALLYRQDQPTTVYRRVFVWAGGSAQSQP